MFDPNNTFQLLAIFDLDNRGETSDMMVTPYPDMIMNAGRWIMASDPKNKTGIACLPSLTIILRFDIDGIEDNLYSFVVTQPDSYFKNPVVGSMDFDEISNNLIVLLSTLAEDNDDDYLFDLYEILGESGSAYEYMVAESYVYYKIEDGNLVPEFNQKPYWMSAKELEEYGGN